MIYHQGVRCIRISHKQYYKLILNPLLNKNKIMKNKHIHKIQEDIFKMHHSLLQQKLQIFFKK